MAENHLLDATRQRGENMDKLLGNWLPVGTNWLFSLSGLTNTVGGIANLGRPD